MNDKFKFKRINAGGVIRNDDVMIQITGPNTLEYKENNNLIILDLGYDPIKKIVYVYVSDVSVWDYADKLNIITESEKKKIIENLKEGLSLLSGKFEVV